MRRIIFSDIHANFEALKSVLADTGEYDQVIFLGDLVNFGPCPSECLELLKSKNALCIMGNHDEQIVSDNPKLPWDKWAKERLTKEQLDYIKTFSDAEIIDEHILVLHGSYAVDYDILPNTSDEDIEKAFNPYLKPNIDEVWFGHYHYQIDRTINGVTYRCIRPVVHHRDKDTRASYSVYENGVVEHKRVEYDVEKTIAALNDIDVSAFNNLKVKNQFLNLVKNAFDEDLLQKDLQAMNDNNTKYKVSNKIY